VKLAVAMVEPLVDWWEKTWAALMADSMDPTLVARMVEHLGEKKVATMASYLVALRVDWSAARTVGLWDALWVVWMVARKAFDGVVLTVVLLVAR